MKARRLPAALAAGALIMSSGSVAVLGVPAFAHGHARTEGKVSAKARVRSRARVEIRDHVAVMLAKALAKTLGVKTHDVAILSMSPMAIGRNKGYLVTYLKGHMEGHLFVSTDTGKVRRYGHMVKVKVRAATSTPASGTSTSQTQSTSATAGVTLSAFLSALETTLASESGAPVTATVEDGGAVTVFTVSVSGQDISVSVDTNQAATTTTTSSQPSFAGPSVSMETAVTTALDDLGALNIQSLANPFAVGVELGGWDGFGPGTAPVYAVSVASAAGGSAYVLVDGTSGALLGVDTLGGPAAPPAQDQGAFGLSAQAPTIAADTALATAMADDASGVPISAELTQSGSGPVWQVDLANANGTVTEVQVSASTGAVVGLETQTNGQGINVGGLFGIGVGGPQGPGFGNGQNPGKDHGDQGNQGNQDN